MILDLEISLPDTSCLYYFIIFEDELDFDTVKWLLLRDKSEFLVCSLYIYQNAAT